MTGKCFKETKDRQDAQGEKAPSRFGNAVPDRPAEMTGPDIQAKRNINIIPANRLFKGLRLG